MNFNCLVLMQLSQSRVFSGAGAVFSSRSTLFDALQAQSLLHECRPSAGYYLSQFLLCGTADVFSMNAGGGGDVIYGDRRIDQRIRHSIRKDFATTWNEWLDLQHGADSR